MKPRRASGGSTAADHRNLVTLPPMPRPRLLPARIALTACVFGLQMLTAQAAVLVHDFYLPMPEAQIRQTFTALETGVGTNLDSVFSVVITGEGTVIYYDQWEDGYETDLAHPAQATTKVWGDGNNLNGIPPGYTNDPVSFPAGTVLTLRNFVPLPRNPANLLYDARDRMAATKALVVSRAAWATTPGSVLAGAVEVQATIDYGTSYVSPVGQDMTNRLFQYVGFLVMAEQDNTSVTIDTDGPGVTAPFAVTLNRGESYLVNGGVKKGGSVNATKPVQVNLVIGRIAGRYATDWFTLYPTNQWSDSYYTPVGTANNGNQTYVYLYNSSASAITINYATLAGSGSFAVAANDVSQFQMPKNSGGRFTSVGGKKFFALSTAGANPASDTAYDWGFTLLPADGLTTEAVVGWGPGSSDGSVNGSPVWVTAVASTRVYVDYNGDRAGALTDPRGNKYDVHYDLAALESKKVYDPDKDQTAMRLYTVDGTAITTAWGEDPDMAAPGNPYLDFGTTVLPFPVPVLKKTSSIFNDTNPPGLSIGDIVEYTIELDNKGLLPLGNTIIVDAPPTNISYVANSTTLDANPIPDNVVGTAFPLDAPGYTIPIILRGGTSIIKFRSQVNASGSISNYVSSVGYNISSQNVVASPPSSGATACALEFTDSLGTNVTTYSAGSTIYVKVVDADANTFTNSTQTMTAVVSNATRGDFEIVTLTETGNNTGVFFSAGGLPSSTTAGVPAQDDTLNVAPGDALVVLHTDLTFGDTCSANATVSTPTLAKVLYLTGTNAPDQSLDRVNPAAAPVDNTTAQSVELGGGTASTIVLDNTSAGISTSNTLTFSHTTGAGANRLMLVGTAFDRGGGDITNVAYNGIALTKILSVTNTSGSVKPRADIWQLVNPPSGTFNVVISMATASSVDLTAGAVTFTGVDQTTPTGTGATATGNSTAASVNVTSASGEMVFDCVSVANTGAANAGPGQTRQWTTNTANIRGAGSTEAGAASVTMSWTNGNARWAIAGVPIKPAVTGGNSTATFAQTPSFCSSFTMPAGGAVSITNFVTVTSGAMPANPAITAQLRIGTTNILTLSSPTYYAANSNLVWTGALGGAVTVPAGQAISYVISNAQAGVSYRVDYDSAAKPARILLPTTTVIDVTSLGIYDAPYPGGSLVTTPIAGSTLYVRAAVSDPFGSYDITSLGLAIDGPGTGGDVSVTLTNSSVVASDSCSKIYEYAWQTIANPGAYNLAVTANEGSEGITDTAAAGVQLTFLDLGTPSVTEFTSGNNGPATNAFPANASICVRVNDLDQNQNSSAAETLTVTVTSSSGDSELVTLTETATNSGIFTACVNASTNSGAGNNNGTLLAPAGSLLTVDYTDPNDAGDQSSASATVLTPPGVPGLTMNKTLVAPADGQAGVGETVQFNLQVVNSGSTTLTNVSVTDNYPASKLSFQSASLAPSSTNAGTLTWANLGNFTPGQVTNIAVNFTAIASAAPALNSATANGGTVTNTGVVGVTITHSALTITKSLLDPTNGPVQIGSNVTFRIVVQNTGDTAIPTVPLEDSFSDGCYSFVSATVTPDGTGAGSLFWGDITGAGSLATNASVTIDVTLLVTGGCDPANNTAHADYAVDVNGDPVPSATSTAGVTTGAGRITGTVYNDIDQSGTLTVGDVALDNVALELFTDPNGDGDPSDGALVQLVNTSPAGEYELLNLATGRYVVVETDLPGYASSAPANNRLPVELASLSTNANNNFFDYVFVPTNYASISGTVWADTNASGTVDLGEPGIANVNVELIQDVNTNGFADLGETVAASTTTDASGHYSFGGVIPGHYVIREIDLYGWISTADSRPPSDSQIGLLAGSGAVTNGNDFLDFFTGNNPGNDAPVANNDNYSTSEDTPLAISAPGILGNDTDVDGDPLTAALVSTTTNGTLTLSTNGGFTYTPNSNYFGSDAFTYRANDGTTNSGLATVNLTINPVNDAPLANDQSVVTPEDVSTNLVLTGSDIEGAITFAILSGPANGTLIGFNSNSGAVTYSPGANFNGSDSFTFTVSDGSLLATGTVSITVTPVNDAPVANDQTVTTPEDTSTNLVLTASDADSTNLVFAILIGPTNGVLSLLDTNTGAVTYSPDTNYHGADSFTFTVSDGSLLATGLVSITVTPVNDPPVANNDSGGTTKNVPATIPVLVNDTDTDGDTLTIISVAVTNGTAVISGTNVVFTPATNFIGTVTIGYTIIDGNGGTNSALITVTVLNSAPVAADDSYSTVEDTVLMVNASGVLTNDSDADGDSLSAVLVTGVTHGSLTLNANGSFSYTPNTNYHGADSFTYRASDGTTNSGVATVNLTVTPANDAPVANNQTVTTPEDTSTNLVLTASDIDSTNLVFAILAGPTNGVLSLLDTNTGAITYSPATNYNGPDSFTFTVSDGSLLATGVVSITVTPVNDTPVTVNDSYNTLKNVALNVSASGVLGNDTDAENDALSALLVSNPTNGSLSLNADGSFLYTPSSNYVGADVFTYRAYDAGATGNVATVTINVGATNTAPVANDDTFTTLEDVPLNVPAAGILTNDVDVDGDSLTALLVTGVTHGSLTLNANGSFSYTPNTNYHGSDSFTCRASDGTTNSGVATVNLTVTPANDAPVANDQTVTTPEDTSTNLVLTASDVDSTNLVFAILTGPTNGALGVLNTNTGAVTYTPATNYNGPDSLTFTVSDGSLLATGWVSITVTPLNDGPLANDQSVTTPEDVATNLVLTASDVDSTNLVFAILTGPTNGALGVINTNTGAVTYTPATNYNGPDSFTFTVTDGSLLATGTVSITVTPVNDGPLAQNQSVTTPEDVSTNLVLVGSDVESAVTYAILSGPAHGCLGLLNTNSGAVTYAPATNYNGPDSFTFTVSDGSLLATGTVSITVTPMNDGPLAQNQSVTTPEDVSTNLVLVGSDVESAVTYAILSGPAHGGLGLLNTNSGAITYSPATNYNGPDSFTFTVSDGTLLATGTVSITVTPVNDAPLAQNQSVTTPEDVSTNLVLVGSDVESAVTYAILSGPAHGSLGLLNTNSGAITYSPATNYNGPDSFTFTVSDGSLLATGTVSITVTPVNDRPVAVDDNFTTAEDTVLVVGISGVLGNDSDVDGDLLTALLVNGPAHGAVTLSTNGSFSYTPTNNYNGSDSFTYRASDGMTNSALATVILTITPVNDPPVAVNDVTNTVEDTSVTITVLTNDSDPEGTPLTISGTSTTNGTAAVSGTNVVFTPSTNFNGTAVFSYTISDGTNSAAASVTITVAAVNDTPVANADVYSTLKNVALNVPAAGVLANDTDVENNPLSALLVNTVTNGTLSLNANGSFLYTPSSNYVGADAFTYRAYDAGATSGVALVTINVLATNYPPVANNDLAATPKNTPVTVPALVNDTDPDGNALSITAISPTNGTATFTTTNVTFTPASNFVGTATIGYTISDGNGGTASALITVSVTNRPPTASGQSVTTVQNTPKAITLAGSDPDSDPLTFATVTGPANGVLSGFNTNTGAITYTPNPTFVGNDSFTFRVNDGLSNSATATVNIAVGAQSDLAVFKTGSASGGAGSNLTFTITVTNLGPSTASNVTVFDQLPASYSLVSAAPAAASVTGNLVRWTAFNLAASGSSNFVVTITPTIGGVFTNVTFATNSTPDPDPSNNDGSSTNSQVASSVTFDQFGILQGPNVFNPQTGLFEQRVTVTNISLETVAAVRLLIGGLRTNVSLYNAAGTNDDLRPYVQYNAPLNPGQTVFFVLEFYVRDRRPFTNTLEAVAILPPPASTNAGTGVVIDRWFEDLRIPDEPRFVIEWASIPGRTYTVIYTDDLVTWLVATPSITANANRTQWYDDGPPKTRSKPLAMEPRFYQVILAPTNP